MNAPVESAVTDLALFNEFSPATLAQYVDLLLNRLVKESLPELAGMVRVRGRLTDPGRPSGRFHYGVKVVDDTGAQIKADIPAALLAGKGIKAGHQVVLAGTLSIRSSNYGVEVRLSAGDIELCAQEDKEHTSLSDSGRMTLERLRSLELSRNPFPEHETLTVDLIQSASVHAQVSLDCRAELDKLPDVLVVNPIPVNMLDPVAIASAIAASSADIVMLIRGGGDASDFAVFDDPRVVVAMTQQRAHRVAGLGHTGNATLLDLVCDFTANTPAQAGAYVREHIERNRRQKTEAMSELRRAKHYIADMSKALATAQAQSKAATELLERAREQSSGIPGWVVLMASVAGAVVMWLVIR